MKNLHVAIACAMFALLSAACVDPDDRDPALDEDTPLADDVVVYETVASVSPDGQIVTSMPRAISVGEQRAQNEARRNGLPSVVYNGYPGGGGWGEQDYGCSYDSLWVYARMDYTGDRICFRGYAYTFYMNQYYRFVVINGHPYLGGTWAIQRGSFLAGSGFGYFSANNPAQGYPDQRLFSSTWWYGTFDFPYPLTTINL